MAKSLREQFLEYLEEHRAAHDRESVFQEEVRSRRDEFARANLGKCEYMWLEQLERMYARAM